MGVPSTGQVRDLLRRHLPDLAVHEVRTLGDGLDNTAFAVDDLVVRFAKEPDQELRASAVRREARVLAVAGRVSPVPVPVPVLVLPERGCLAYRRLPGVPLIEARGAAEPVAVAAVLAELLRALHGVPVAEVADVLEADDEPLEVWRDDAAEQYAAARALVPERVRAAVEAFLAAPPPPPGGVAVLSHDDLGIEHVLVDPGSGAVTGVIDWTDAGLVDPATDCGRILRDLGAAALDAVLARLGADLRDRALFYARCGVLEDLAHGLESGRRAYVDKSLDALDALFAPARQSP
ncbi:phosphotransferase family protein [Pseudonocardia humida]|uniref:Aminoglycoside phosphotransferase family protein n=1 Tax=Pseudonocardia humida TaxID=2800819 RepID=A0ABT1ADB9_9PSEU|nr:phosphotransferase [Pseudonocardia humida]MCO1661067.1 aminoglycoside phosphotransferase family protein [Pseudonocardia humida]